MADGPGITEVSRIFNLHRDTARGIPSRTVPPGTVGGADPRHLKREPFPGRQTIIGGHVQEFRRSREMFVPSSHPQALTPVRLWCGEMIIDGAERKADHFVPAPSHSDRCLVKPVQLRLPGSSATVTPQPSPSSCECLGTSPAATPGFGGENSRERRTTTRHGLLRVPVPPTTKTRMRSPRHPDAGSPAASVRPASPSSNKLMWRDNRKK